MAGTLTGMSDRYRGGNDATASADKITRRAVELDFII
jgi:hypothetical protein